MCLSLFRDVYTKPDTASHPTRTQTKHNQALFLLAQLSCLVYFTVDAWTGRRVLRLFYLTLVSTT